MASSRSLVARRHTKDEAPSVIVALEGRSYLWSRLGELMEHPRACAHDPPTNTQAWARAWAWAWAWAYIRWWGLPLAARVYVYVCVGRGGGYAG